MYFALEYGYLEHVSRAELAQLKAEEVSSVDSSDSVLLGHLDRKLGSLEQEQTDLMGASYDIKVI